MQLDQCQCIIFRKKIYNMHAKISKLSQTPNQPLIFARSMFSPQQKQRPKPLWPRYQVAHQGQVSTAGTRIKEYWASPALGTASLGSAPLGFSSLRSATMQRCNEATVETPRPPKNQEAGCAINMKLLVFKEPQEKPQ